MSEKKGKPEGPKKERSVRIKDGRGKISGIGEGYRRDSKVPHIKVDTPMPPVKPPKDSGKGSKKKG